jgi:hypothetical protein
VTEHDIGDVHGYGVGCSSTRRTLPCDSRQFLHDLLADERQVESHLDKDGCRNAMTLAQDPEQHVLGTDVVVTELQCLSQAHLEYLLRPRSERRRTCRLARDIAQGLAYLVADHVPGHLEPGQHPSCDPLPLVDECKKDVLAPDEAVPEIAGFLLSED